MYKLNVLIVVIALFSSCSEADEKVHGNGDVQATLFEIQDFDKVETNGAFEVTYIQDTLWGIEIEAESNILPLIEVYKSGSKLVVENEDNYSFDLNFPIKVVIHHSGISYIEFNGAGSIDLGNMEKNTITTSLSGAGNIEGNIKSSEIDFIISGTGNVDATVDCYELEASVSGTGNFNFVGNATRGIFSMSGVGDISALNLEIQYAWCTISGMGDASLNVSEELNATISGIGNISYKGSATVNQNISGAGEIIKID
ncbi:MAG: DUF2807 domain-containing protein [Salinivirgaceae bacterium]|jgi:hypothetical protein|nr:DUF2807 domain-containing protein [Salinivirgaceae bacterium]